MKFRNTLTGKTFILDCDYGAVIGNASIQVLVTKDKYLMKSVKLTVTKILKNLDGIPFFIDEELNYNRAQFLKDAKVLEIP
jgi:hypothetical protein